jgi:hypothetical protein
MNVDDKDDIGNTLDRILFSIEATFEQANVALPERRYFHAGGDGSTVHDCEQLTIAFSQVYQGLPGAQGIEPEKCDAPLSGVFVIELVRCVPDKLYTKGKQTRVPQPADLSMHAKVQGIDAYLLMQAGLLVGNDAFGSMVNVVPGLPSGAYQAMTMELVTGIY